MADYATIGLHSDLGCILHLIGTLIHVIVFVEPLGRVLTSSWSLGSMLVVLLDPWYSDKILILLG